MSHKKFGPDRFSRFDVYWIQTDRQTDKHQDKLNLFFYFQYFHLKLKSRPGLTRARKTCIRFLRFKNHVLVCNNLETELSIYTFPFNRICQQKRIKKGGSSFYLICQIVIKLWSAVLWDKDQTVISAWDNVFLVQMPNAIKKYISELNFS